MFIYFFPPGVGSPVAGMVFFCCKSYLKKWALGDILLQFCSEILLQYVLLGVEFFLQNSHVEVLKPQYLRM